MRTIPIALAAAASSRASTMVWGFKLTRLDAESYGWTSHDRPATISSVTYEPSGLNISQLVISAGLNVDTAIVTIAGTDDVTRADILAGRWDSAAFEIFRYSWVDPTDGIAVMMTGKLGNVKPKDGEFEVELRDIRQPLQQDTADVFQPDCRYRLGDSRCTVDLAPFTFDDEVTAVASAYEFTSTGLTQDADFFGEGEVIWLTGLNAGIRSKVRDFESGVVTLSLPLLFAIDVGDTFTIIAGCRKRHQEDCKTKFDNVINFGGEYDKKTVSELAESADY